MKKIVSVLLMLALLLGAMPVAAAEGDVLGQPFPEFSATDTQGQVFTLSEALKDHEAVLINLWATWCTPCEAEMPFLNEVYAQYGDRVAFIALSREESDTMEMIEAYRQAHGLTFPMGRDEGAALYSYIGDEGIPATVIVDRFGNAAFLQVGSFLSVGDVMRVIEAFLGDGYTETTVLTDVPRDASTRAFPVSSTLAIRVENEGVKTILTWVEGEEEPTPVYVLSDDVAHLRLELPASYDPALAIFYNYSEIYSLQDLLDPARGAYVMDQPLPRGEEDGYYVCVLLLPDGDSDDDMLGAYLLPSDERMEELVEEMRSWGYEVTWEYGEYVQPEPVMPTAYILHVVDQDGQPVPGMTVNFCTATTCISLRSDETGEIRFEGAPDVYHVQPFRAPEGYSFDAGFEFNTGRTYGEWRLRIRKD